MLKRKKKIIAKVMATTMLASTMATTFAIDASAAEPKATVNSSTVLAGTDRYQTAIKISENGWSSSTNAVLINGETGLVDALTATPYASLKNAPILITHKDNLTPATLTRLKAMNVKNVDIVGGVNSVSENVVNQLKANGMTVNRLAGNSRYETGLEVAKAMDKISDVSKIAVVNGEKGLPDAVSVAAPAADNKMPIILAHPTKGLDTATKTFINGESISKSYVIGSTGSLSDSIANTLPGTKTRLGGSDRHDTNAKVIKEFYTQKSLDNIYVAKSGHVKSETELVDALAAGVLAAKNDDPVLLVGKTLGSTQETLLKEKSFTKITQVGGSIPDASINAIKDTQKDPEATVSGVTLVNYKTIKITGKELNRIDKSKVSISGNTTSSYTVNSAGTEATVEFNNAFSNGINTVKITSNLGNVTSHTFTYSTGISTVEATTKEVATEGIQYLGFTVNGGQKRSIEELKDLGWTVEFKSSKNIFYNDNNPLSPLTTSKTGKLKTTGLKKNDIFDYEVILTNGNQTIKTIDKKLVTITDITTDLKSIKSYDANFNNRGSENNSFKSNKLLVGESITLSNLKGIRNDGTEVTLTSGTTLKSSDATVLTVSGMNITARKVGTATITISNENITKMVTIQVLDASNNAREVKSVSYYIGDSNKSSIVLTKSSAPAATQVKVKAIDQHGDPINDLTALEKVTVDTTATPSEKIADLSIGSFTNGEATMNITPVSNKIGTGIIRLQKTVAGKTTILGSLTLTIQDAVANRETYNFTRTSGSEDLKLDRYSYKNDDSVTLKFNTYDSNGNLKLPQADINTSDYILKGYDTDLITVTKGASNSGEITITPTSNKTKYGSTTVSLYHKVGSIETFKSSVTITIEDTTPVIKTIDMNNINTISKINASDPEFDLLDLFKINYTHIGSDIDNDVVTNESHYKKVVEGVTVIKSSSKEAYSNQEVLMSLTNASAGGNGAEAILFIDRPDDSGDRNGEFDLAGIGHTKGDFVLATIKIEPSGVSMTTPSVGKRKLNPTTNNGSIIVAMYDGIYAPNKTPKDTVINVDIPR